MSMRKPSQTVSITNTNFPLHHIQERTMTEPTQAQRILSEADAFCPSCGHNRDKSSVSSIDHGTFKSCQKCGATWTEVALPTTAQVEDDRCITTHLWQHTGQGGSMGKEMRCDRCGNTKWIPW